MLAPSTDIVPAVQPGQVAFGEEARRFCDLYGIELDDVREAYREADSITREAPYVILVGDGPSGQRYRMTCRETDLGIIKTVRPVAKKFARRGA
jgi:hypothetical protein